MDAWTDGWRGPLVATACNRLIRRCYTAGPCIWLPLPSTMATAQRTSRIHIVNLRSLPHRSICPFAGLAYDVLRCLSCSWGTLHPLSDWTTIILHK